MAEENLQHTSSDETDASDTAGFANLLAKMDAMRKEAEALRARIAELEELADIDAMVPVYNRRAFLRECARIMAFAQRHDVSTALLFLDLDGFKSINDSHGHAIGDQVLEAVADCLLQQVRETDVVGRLGGDEFAVMLAAASLEGAAEKARTLAKAIRDLCISINGQEIGVGASIGVEMVRADDSPEALLERADAAMYAEKHTKRTGDGRKTA